MLGGDNIKTLTIRLDDETHKAFKMYSVKTGKDMQDILREYIKKLIQSDSQGAKK
jgi:predicted DNA-binding protein